MFAAGNMMLANIYPVTASMGLIQYRSYDAAVYWNIGLCSISMITVLLISAAIVATMKSVSSTGIIKKTKKPFRKKAGRRTKHKKLLKVSLKNLVLKTGRILLIL